MLCLEFLFDSM